MHNIWTLWSLYLILYIILERIISHKEVMVPLYVRRDREEIKIYLKRRPLPIEAQEKRSRRMGMWVYPQIYEAVFINAFSGRGKSIKHHVKSTPPSVLFRQKLSWQKLSCIRWFLQRELRQRRKKYRDILYKRLAKREPLWTPAELTPLDILRIILGNLREHNLALCKYS